MIKLVLTDLDDTLLSHALRMEAASDHAMRAIRALLDAGVHFGPVSGRTPVSMGSVFHDYAPAFATGAFNNGQLVRLDGEVVHEEWCAPEPLQRVADLMDEVAEGALALYAMDGAAWYVTRRNDLGGVGQDFGAGRFGRAERVEGPSLKANVHFAGHDRARHTELRDLLRAEVPELDFVFPSNTTPLVDILPSGYGKGSAALILARELGIGLDEVATFGDSENDLSMLEAVPNAVSVANASAAAKAATRWHIGDVSDDATADAFFAIAEASAIGEMPAFMR